MAEKKIYVGNGKKKSATWIKGSICLSDIPKEFINVGKNGKKYLLVNINIYDKENDYGSDVSITVDTWKPDQKPEPKVEPEIPKTEDDLPF